MGRTLPRLSDRRCCGYLLRTGWRSPDLSSFCYGSRSFGPST